MVRKGDGNFEVQSIFENQIKAATNSKEAQFFLPRRHARLTNVGSSHAGRSLPLSQAHLVLLGLTGRCEQQVPKQCQPWLDTRGGRAATKPQNKRKKKMNKRRKVKLNHKSVIVSEAKPTRVNHPVLPPGSHTGSAGCPAPSPSPPCTHSPHSPRSSAGSRSPPAGSSFPAPGLRSLPGRDRAPYKAPARRGRRQSGAGRHRGQHRHRAQGTGHQGQHRHRHRAQGTGDSSGTGHRAPGGPRFSPGTGESSLPRPAADSLVPARFFLLLLLRPHPAGRSGRWGWGCRPQGTVPAAGSSPSETLRRGRRPGTSRRSGQSFFVFVFVFFFFTFYFPFFPPSLQPGSRRPPTPSPPPGVAAAPLLWHPPVAAGRAGGGRLRLALRWRRRGGAQPPGAGRPPPAGSDRPGPAACRPPPESRRGWRRRRGRARRARGAPSPPEPAAASPERPRGAPRRETPLLPADFVPPERSQLACWSCLSPCSCYTLFCLVSAPEDFPRCHRPSARLRPRPRSCLPVSPPPAPGSFPVAFIATQVRGSVGFV
ncbi:transmembrane protein 200A isoform X2 [Anser cygnoides]|uniref:transmembrane protein 200A isoform X2 n=1 Tax=Anser cygnoides TaxID=8845 RepID=UPI0034D384FA